MDVAQQITRLNALWRNAQEPKLLWEEMQVIAQQAFAVQAEAMEALDRSEKTASSVAAVQSVFAAREQVWDIAGKIAAREQEIKEKTFKRGNP
ncbi:MAG: hypothetical protein PHX68_04465 [Alphaproteobacteria bacterium]|nr:hypothetical protein [Alphaproteobacteria bacterium]